MVLAVPVPPQRPASFPLKIQAGRVEKRQRQVREQVAPPRKERLLHEVLRAPRGPRRRLGLPPSPQLLPQPGHRSIQMLKVQRFRPRQHLLTLPLLRRPVAPRPRRHQPMQHRHEHRPLHRKAELAAFQELTQHRRHLHLLPQLLEHQRRPQAARPEDLGRPAAVLGQHRRPPQEFVQRRRQPAQGVRLLQQIAPAQRADDPLADLALDAFACDQLQVLVRPVGLDADEHGVASV